MKQFSQIWREALKKRTFAIQITLLVVSILLIVSLLPSYFHSVIGPKPGIQLNDLVLNLFLPQDHSWIIFGLIYLSLMVLVHGIASRPLLVLLGLKCYLLITLLRIITIYVFTLEPPAGIIPLHDPIVDVIAYGGQVFAKDLFFSGHVATLTLFVLLEERAVIKKILMVNTIIVAGLILLQRVHYTIDVIAAPLMMMGVFKLMKHNFVIHLKH